MAQNATPGDASLIPGETTILRMRQHWIVLVRGVLAAVALTVALVYTERALHGWFPGMSHNVDTGVVLVYLGFLIPWTIVPFLQWLTTIYLFTDRRIVTRTGLLRIRGEAITLSKVNSVQFSKTLLERLLGSGSLIIETAAENQVLIRHVSGAEEVQQRIHVLIDELGNARD